jgi:membrane-associated protease RseP (regulator of RpoE activity)
VVPPGGDPPATADFELSRGGRLTGVVVARGDRRPIAQARVAVEGAATSLGVPVRNETITDEAGRFTVGGLGESTVGLLVSARGHHGRVVTVPSVREGDTQGPVTIDLAPVAPGEEERLEVAGIGAALLKQGASLVVTMVAPSGGAAEAGIAVGDEVIAIDGAPVAPMTLAEAIPRLRGPEGSTVTLGVVKAGDAQRTAIPVVVARRVVRT